jgi:hypothetical protein
MFSQVLHLRWSRRLFSGFDTPFSEALRAFGYLFAIAFGLIAGALRSSPMVSDADHTVMVFFGVGCLATSLFFIAASTSTQHCRARRLFRCGLWALIAFFVAAAFNLEIYAPVTVVDLLALINATLGARVAYLFVRAQGEVERREAAGSRVAHGSSISAVKQRRHEIRFGEYLSRSRVTAFGGVAGLLIVCIKLLSSPY